MSRTKADIIKPETGEKKVAVEPETIISAQDGDYKAKKAVYDKALQLAQQVVQTNLDRLKNQVIETGEPLDEVETKLYALTWPIVAVLDTLRVTKQKRMCKPDAHAVSQTIPGYVVTFHNSNNPEYEAMIMTMAGNEIKHAALLGYLLGRAAEYGEHEHVFDLADIHALEQAGIFKTNIIDD